METQTASITDFDTLLSRIENTKDKLLCACIATFADAGLAEQFISHLVNLPEPVDQNKIFEFNGKQVKASHVAGLSPQQASKALGISEQNVCEIQKYLGLNNQNKPQDNNNWNLKFKEQQ